MSNEITAYKIYSSGVILRGVKRLEGADKDSLVQLLFDIAAQVAEHEQSPTVDHAAMMAKLRELQSEVDDAGFDKSNGYISDKIGVAVRLDDVLDRCATNFGE